MSDDAYGATVAKRRLSRRLAELRTDTCYTANHVCDILNWGRGKVGRFEANQWKRPEMSDIRDLIRIYGADGEARDEIEELAVRCRVRAWWRDNEFPGYENDAASIQVFMPLVLPGLLQTPAYMAVQLKAGPWSLAWRRRAVEARLRRQEILDRADETAPHLSVVITRHEGPPGCAPGNPRVLRGPVSCVRTAPAARTHGTQLRMVLPASTVCQGWLRPGTGRVASPDDAGATWGREIANAEHVNHVNRVISESHGNSAFSTRKGMRLMRHLTHLGRPL